MLELCFLVPQLVRLWPLNHFFTIGADVDMIHRSNIIDSKAVILSQSTGTMSLSAEGAVPSEMTTPITKTSTFSSNSDGQASSQSSLSSVPSDIGPTPEGLGGCLLDTSRTRSGSPVSRRSQRVRKQRVRATGLENSDTSLRGTTTKRRKISASRSVSDEASTRTSFSRGPHSAKSSDNLSKRPRKSPRQLHVTNARPLTPLKFSEIFPESNVRGESLPTEFSEIISDESSIIKSFFTKLQTHQSQPTSDHNGSADYLEDNTSDQSPTHNRAMRYAAASAADKGSNNGSADASPSEKTARSNIAGKPAKGHGKFGRGKARNGGNGGRDRESPEPNEKAVKTTSDQVLLKSVRQRQLELKRWFSIIGAQQAEALEIMVSRDLSKLHKKSTAHTKVHEHDELLSSLRSKGDKTKALIDREHRMRQDLALKSLQAQEELIEIAFRRRANEAKTEHLKGAEGDLMILQSAHKAKVDETRTDNGSEVADILPLYHELPEPNARIRGYSSTRIDDEKPFKEHLASYDEQAQREVIDDDIVAPVMQSVAKDHAERTAEEERKAREKMDQLAAISGPELERINHHRVPRPSAPQNNPQFNLSRLADCADLMREREREQKHGSVSETLNAGSRLVNETLPRLPRNTAAQTVFQQPQPLSGQNSSARPKSPATRKKKTSISVPTRRGTREEEVHSQSSSSTSTPLPNIAPAPPRMPPPPPSNQHHYHNMPPQGMLPPLSTTPVGLGFARHSSLAPLIIPKPSSTPPGTPIYSQGYPQSSHLPPPPSPYQPRPSPISSSFQPLSAGPRPKQSYHPVTHPAPPSPFNSQPPRSQNFELGMQRSPTEQLPPPPPPPPPPAPLAHTTQPLQPAQSTPNSVQPSTSRFALNNSISPHVSRHLGQRRGSGQITFTPTQTPSSERFTRPPGPAPQLPGRSVIRPAQLGINTSSTHSRSTSGVNVGSESRGQTAADIARQNAAKNQVQGAGPKGGRRVLLPKG